MKKLMFLAILMIVPGMMVFAHSGYYPQQQPRQGSDFWQDMNATHDIMHNTSIKETQLENGLILEVSAESDSIKTSIQKKFVDEKVRLGEFFRGVDVAVESFENGVRITLTSENETVQRQLKESGKGLIYEYVHAGFMGFRNNRGYHCGNYGSRWNGDGYMGPGMMDGYHHRW